jgi:two-component system response regulator NreC
LQQVKSVILTDDNEILRKGLAAVLEKDPEFCVTAEAGDGSQLLKLLEQGVQPDVLILDLSMPIMSGMEALRQIRQAGFKFKVLILTMNKDQDLVCESFLAGADGFILKDEAAAGLLLALRVLFQDRIFVSPMMAAELPDTCALKAEQAQCPLASSVNHCRAGLAE